MKHIGKDYQKRIIDVENIIPEDEPVFLLRGKDPFAAVTLAYYASMLKSVDLDLSKKVYEHAKLMTSYSNEENPTIPTDEECAVEHEEVVSDLTKEEESAKEETEEVEDKKEQSYIAQAPPER